MAISSDSDEYWILTEAVELSKDVEGFLCEVGVRAGWGTKTIIDAAIEHRPGSTVIGIDPYGSIEYIGREHMGPCRLDYDDLMGKQCQSDLSAYVIGKNVLWLPFKMKSETYFRTFADGMELYDLETTVCNKYAMVHLDGVHTVSAISKEVLWFHERMDSGACIAIDDVTIDFVDIKPIQQLFIELGWAEIKMGLKKGLWRKN